jgi:adenine-specific DNA-methyltransferase
MADELREDGELTEADFAVVLTALMHAMAYCSQGTGHFAQYRDAKTVSSMRDISIYRRKQMDELFVKKVASLRDWNFENVVPDRSFQLSADDYRDCLAQFEGGTVYADPPYAFVHYSRFYHALETLVLYDYPELQIKGGKVVKGRYREDRHQSPFSIRSLVPEAFKLLFEGSRASNSNLVLSYSDTGLFALDDLCDLASGTLGPNYDIRTMYLDHQHMTMGRKDDRHREVQEALLIAKCKIK